MNTANKNDVNVKDFGAVGDGVTDDTLAFKKAIDSAITNGKMVHIPKGIYALPKKP